MRIVSGILNRGGITGSVLVLGDSTCAHCVDKQRVISRRELQSQVNDAVGEGADVYFACFSGAKLCDFVRQARSMAKYGENCYDSVLVVGGWNSSSDTEESVAGDIGELLDYCESRILNSHKHEM